MLKINYYNVLFLLLYTTNNFANPNSHDSLLNRLTYILWGSPDLRRESGFSEESESSASQGQNNTALPTGQTRIQNAYVTSGNGQTPNQGQPLTIENLHGNLLSSGNNNGSGSGFGNSDSNPMANRRGNGNIAGLGSDRSRNDGVQDDVKDNAYAYKQSINLSSSDRWFRPGGGLSEVTLRALKEEETRQLALANESRLKTEHERNRWFNALAQYMGTQQSEHTDVLMKQARELLNGHHQVLEKLEKERSSSELEKERIRQKNLPQLLRHDLEKTKLLHQQFIERLVHIGNGIYAFTGDREHMAITALTLSSVIFGLYTSKHGTRVAANYASSLLMKPSLVTETSRVDVSQFFRHPWTTMMRKKPDLPKGIFSSVAQRHIENYITSIQEGRRDAQPFRHGLLYGPPGTGKTLLAKTIAHNLGMDYAIIPGANIHQFGGQAVTELNKLFDWAERAKKGTVLFFDEVDALVPNRLGVQVSEQTRQIQNTLYARTGTETDKFLLLAATNTPKILDPAFLSRMDERINFDVPDEEARIKLFLLYFNQYVKGTNVYIEGNVETTLTDIAKAIEGFSGRDISQLARAVRAEAYSNDNKVDAELLRTVTQKKINQHNQLQNI